MSRAVKANLRAFFLTPGYALDLAVFRVAIFGALLLYLVTERTEIMTFAGLPPMFLEGPFGWQGLVSSIPVNPAVANLSWWLAATVATAGLIGCFARPAAWISVVLALYVLAIPQFFGKVDHNSQHLIWFLAILGCSRCSDALALDGLRWRRAGRPPPRDPALLYSLPLRFVWLLLGVTYLFAGLPKLTHGGIELRGYLHARWSELDWQPAVRIDNYPALLELAGIATIVFECSFLFLIFFPRLRPIAAVTGLVFHNFTFLTMKIWFWTLQAAYVSFVPWSRLLGRQSSDPEATRPQPVSSLRAGLVPLTAVAGCLLAAQVVFGAAAVGNGWPFSAYPAFTGSPKATHKTVVVVAVGPGGRRSRVDLSPLRERMSGERLYQLIKQVPNDDPTRQRALLAVVRRYGHIPPTTRSLYLYRARMSVDPDGPSDPQVTKLLTVQRL